MEVARYMSEGSYFILKKLLHQLGIHGEGPSPAAGKDRYYHSEHSKENILNKEIESLYLGRLLWKHRKLTSKNLKQDVKTSFADTLIVIDLCFKILFTCCSFLCHRNFKQFNDFHHLVDISPATRCEARLSVI